MSILTKLRLKHFSQLQLTKNHPTIAVTVYLNGVCVKRTLFRWTSDNWFLDKIFTCVQFIINSTVFSSTLNNIFRMPCTSVVNDLCQSLWTFLNQGRIPRYPIAKEWRHKVMNQVKCFKSSLISICGYAALNS